MPRFILDLWESRRIQSSAMRFDWPATKRIAQHYFAILIMLWWGGLNCLSGCLMSSTGVISESHCSMGGGGGDCCQAQTGAEGSLSSKSIGAPFTSFQSLSCCSLLSLTADVSRDSRATDVAPASAILGAAPFTPVSDPRAQLPDRWARLPDRGGTRLLNCVFLI